MMRSLIADLREGRSESLAALACCLSPNPAVCRCGALFCAFNRVLSPVGRIAVTPQSRTREYERSFTSGHSAMKWSLVLFLSLASHFTHAETGSLVGVWQIQSTVYDGKEQSIRTPEQIKIFTEEHVFYTYYDPNLGTAEPLLSVGHGRTHSTMERSQKPSSITQMLPSLERHSALALNSAKTATRSNRSSISVNTC